MPASTPTLPIKRSDTIFFYLIVCLCICHSLDWLFHCVEDVLEQVLQHSNIESVKREHKIKTTNDNKNQYLHKVMMCDGFTFFS